MSEEIKKPEETKSVSIRTEAKYEALAHVDDNYLNPHRFDQIFRIAKVFAASDLVPDHFKGKDTNCFIAIQMALKAKIDPLTALQNLYVVHGKPGIESKLAIAMANASGRLRGTISYEERGVPGSADFAVTAKAVGVDGSPMSHTVSMKDAEAAGWTKNRAYQTMPALMLKYRAAMFLIRTHMPEVVFGMQSKEELEDVRALKNVTPDMATLPASIHEYNNDDIPFGEPRKTPILSKKRPIKEPDAVTIQPSASTPAASGSDLSNAKPWKTKAHEIIEKLLEGQNSSVTEAFLNRLKTKKLEDSDHLIIPEAVREANEGSLGKLKSIFDRRPTLEG